MLHYNAGGETGVELGKKKYLGFSDGLVESKKRPGLFTKRELRREKRKEGRIWQLNA